MALPNANPMTVQNQGINPASVQQQNNVNQKIAEILSGIEAKLGNITNIRTTIQSSIYESFGNNFLSRTLNQLTSTVFDTFDSFFADEKKEDDDPVVAQLKIHSNLLTSILEVGNKSLIDGDILDADLTLVREDLKEMRKNDTLLSNATLSMLNTINDTLLNLSNPRASDKNRKNKKTLSPNDANDSCCEKQSAILNSILLTMRKDVHISEQILKLQNDKISTQEQDLEDANQRRIPKTKTDATDVRDKTNDTWLDKISNMFKKFDFTRLITGLLDVGANLLGLKSIIKLLTGAFHPLLSIVTRVGSRLFVLVKDVLLSISKTIAKWSTNIIQMIARNLPSAKIIGGALAAAAAPLLAMWGVKEWAEDASIKDKDGNFTATGQTIDTIQRAVGGNGITPDADKSDLKRFEESINVGFWQNLFGKKDQLRKNWNERFGLGTKVSSEEAVLLKKHLDIDVPVALIKKNQEEVTRNLSEIQVKQDDLQKALDKKTSGSDNNVQVNNNNVTHNQTIIPTRTQVQNPDRSYSRYIDRQLGY